MTSHHCPQCGHQHSVPKAFLNRLIKCQNCRFEFPADATPKIPEKPKPTAPPPVISPPPQLEQLFREDFPAIGCVILGISVLVTFIGCLQSVGGDVVNLHAVSVKLNTIIIGCTWSLIGAIFIAASYLKPKK